MVPLKLFEPRVLNNEVCGTPAPKSPVPGQVLDRKAFGEDGLVVAVADGAIGFDGLQFAGRKRMDARSALAGRDISPGTVLQVWRPPS